MTRLSTRSAAALGAALLFTAILAGCGSPTATPSPSLVPTPEATPDVAQVFVASMTSPDFQAVSDMSGTLSIQSEGITIEGTIEGEYRFSGGDSASSLTMTMAGVTQQQDEVSIDGATYASTDGGPYVLAEADEGSDQTATLNEILAGLESLRDAGAVEHYGRTVRELKPTDPIDLDPATLGLTDPSMANADVSMAFYAETDGMPAGFSVAMTWTQGLDTGALADAEVVIDFEFTDLESPVVIEPPEDTWVWWSAADAPFMIAYPKGWSTDVAFGTLLISPPDGAGFFSISLSDPPPEQESQETFSAASLAAMASLGATPSGTLPYEVESISSTLVAYRDAYADTNSLVLHLPLFDGTYGYEIQLAAIAAPGEEGQVQDEFDAFMSTFAFTQ